MLNSCKLLRWATTAVCVAVFLASMSCRHDPADDDRPATEDDHSSASPVTPHVQEHPHETNPPPAIGSDHSTPANVRLEISSRRNQPAATLPQTDPPHTRPATATDVATPAFQPLADASPGEWAEYTTLDRSTLRYEVKTVSVTGVKTEITIKTGGRPLGLPAVRTDRADFDPIARQADRTRATRSHSPCKIDVAGRTWEAQLCEDRWMDEDVSYLRRTWISPEAPVLGILQMELLGDGKLENGLVLRHYGTSPPAP